MFIHKNSITYEVCTSPCICIFRPPLIFLPNAIVFQHFTYFRSYCIFDFQYFEISILLLTRCTHANTYISSDHKPEAFKIPVTKSVYQINLRLVILLHNIPIRAQQICDNKTENQDYHLFITCGAFLSMLPVSASLKPHCKSEDPLPSIRRLPSK